MKKSILFLIMVMISTTSVFAQKTAKVEFSETVFNFGNIAEVDGDATCKFVFKNTGKVPLIITRASASCGCTKPEYPEAPIAPGKTGEIRVTYHAKGRPGAFQKNVYIYTDANPEKYTLLIKGTVIPESKKK